MSSENKTKARVTYKSKPPQVGMLSLGCAKNLVDSEAAMSILSDRGYNLTNGVGPSEVAVINTCGFIKDAVEEGLEEIMELIELKRQGHIKAIVVTGCLVERYKKEGLKDNLEEIDAFLGASEPRKIAQTVERLLSRPQLVSLEKDMPAVKVPNSAILTPGHYAYLKVAEGCSNRCAYCTIPSIRGPLKSKPFDEVLEEARLLSMRPGLVEMNIIAQDTASYGVDLYGKSRLAELVWKIANSSWAPGWIRILYVHPASVTDELIETIAGHDRILKYMDVPIQHASGRILKAMSRKQDEKDLKSFFRKLKERIPGITLRTTVMVGFPGETEDDFIMLKDFLRWAEFDRIGHFIYSPEDGTAAVNMAGKVHHSRARRRAREITELSEDMAAHSADKMIGGVFEAVVEDEVECTYIGRLACQAPEVDGIVEIRNAGKLKIGKLVNVKLTGHTEYDFVGIPAS